MNWLYEIWDQNLIRSSLADKNPENDNGFTPLHEAAKNGNLNICQLILKNIKEDNPMNKSTGVTALHMAAENGHFDICQLIINNIADKVWVIRNKTSSTKGYH